MATGILGQRHTAVTDQTLKTREIESEIVMLQPERAPFTSFMMALGSSPTKQIKFEHPEDDVQPCTVTVNGSHAASGAVVSLQLDAGHAVRLSVPCVLWYAAGTNGEAVRITARDASTDIATMVRNYNGAGLDTIADNAVLSIVNESREEGVAYANAISSDPTTLDNFVQEFETAVEMSDIEMATEDYTKPTWNHQVEKAAIEHKEKIERAYLWGINGGPHLGPNNRRFWNTGGMWEFIKEAADSRNFINAPGTLTKRPFDRFLAFLNTYGRPGRKIITGSPNANLSLTSLAEGAVEISNSEDTLGMTIKKVKVNGRIYPFVENQQFDKVMGSVLAFMVIDMSLVKARHLAANGYSFTTKWIREIQARNLKGRHDVVHSVCGLQRKVRLAHGVYYNFT